MKIPITVFQALTLLAEKYQADETNEALYASVKSLYLSGVRTPSDVNRLENLMHDAALNNYFISTTKKDINEDPVRRYFESQLCYETLNVSLKMLDFDLVSQHFSMLMAEEPLTDNDLFHMDECWHQYKKNIKFLKENSDSALLESRTAYFLYAIFEWCMRSAGRLDLSLAAHDGYLFDDEFRGRQTQVDPVTEKLQDIRSHHLGIMKSYMPLAQNDDLYKEDLYQRYVSKYTYLEGCPQPEMAFANLVTPFVGSISGCIWRQMLTIEQFTMEDRFVFNNNEEQLKYYFKCFISFGVFFLGIHSLNEFMSVLRLPEVQNVFRFVPGFISMTMDLLFIEENENAFRKALNKTIVYNTFLLNQTKVNYANPTVICVSDSVFRPRLSDFIIHYFSRYEKLSPIEFFVKGRSDVIYGTDANALLWLALKGHNQTLEFFIQFGVDVNKSNVWVQDYLATGKNTTLTALDLALTQGHLIAALLLLGAGARANQIHQTINSLTLSDMIKKGNLNGVELLIKLNPSFLNQILPSGYSAVQEAELYDWPEIAHYLMAQGADVNLPAHSAESTMKDPHYDKELSCDKTGTNPVIWELDTRMMFFLFTCGLGAILWANKLPKSAVVWSAGLIGGALSCGFFTPKKSHLAAKKETNLSDCIRGTGRGFS